ncbi:MAG: flagellar hook-length control protein, partial [Sulfurimonas sp. RIFCSPLOWO2_12_FULL_34_6]
SLLKNEDKVSKKSSQEPLELNPKLTASLSSQELKALVSDAKNYLKEKILNSDEYKKSEIKELPKTLKGLAEAAKKLGIDVTKITVEEVKVQTNKTDAKEDKKVLIKEELFSKDMTQDKKIKTSPSDDKQKNIAANNVQNAEALSSDDKKNSEKTIQLQQEIKTTPLFRAQTSSEHTTTQQIVQAKINNLHKTEEKTPKEKADETLKLLLRGEKSSANNSSLTADFSVATAKVIAPSATQENTKTLEKLLQGESFVNEQNPSTGKTEMSGVHKADSFELKLNEAKQMIKYLSSDIKNAIEEYKSPFTRVKVQLNPQNLGEVDLTVVQRGKNLHVNISSNNSAINMLSMNSNELKTQLNNSGINNATLNFSNGSQNSDSNSNAQHQQRQNERRANEEYNYFENEQSKEEILSSLEIIVPKYI